MTAQSHYQVAPNLTYLVQNGYEDKLDIYQRRNTTNPQPTLFYIHGGGWIGGTKETAFLSVLPWLEMGWTVVNVETRGSLPHEEAAMKWLYLALRPVSKKGGPWPNGKEARHRFALRGEARCPQKAL